MCLSSLLSQLGLEDKTFEGAAETIWNTHD